MTTLTDSTPVIVQPTLPQSVEIAEIDDRRVTALTAELMSGALEPIHAFGRDLTAQTAAQTDSVLGEVRPTELDLIGSKLSQIVGAAQSLNLHALSSGRSKIPLIGALIDKFWLKKNEVVRHFQSVSQQVESLIGEVNVMQQGLEKRIDSLDESFLSVKNEHNELATYVKAGETAISQLKPRLEQMRIAAKTPIQVQEVQDLSTATRNLEKRVADLKMLQHSALQQLPMIRMVQANNRMLIEKFHTIRDLTVPAWKRQFVLALSLHEQQNAVRLAETVDDATNAFLRENAKLLKDNTVSTAKANQRLVIDIETLKQVQDSLVSTVQEVIKINQEGQGTRAQVSIELGQMRESLAKQLAT